MSVLLGIVVVVFVAVLLVVVAVSSFQGTSDRSGRAERAALEVESLFAPAKRHQVEQQEIVDTSRVDASQGDGNPLERYTDAERLRRRWDDPGGPGR